MTCTTPHASAGRTDGERFLTQLIEESRSHRAVHHPFLQQLQAGAFADTRAVLRDFACNYNCYSAWFPRYLRAVIGNLESPQHRRLLAQNLAEEKGRLDPDDYLALREVGIDPHSVAGIPHPELFRRFCRALGLDRASLSTPHADALRWRVLFLSFLHGASPAAAVGALGLGTETIVKHIYRPILDGIRRFADLRRSDYVFFELHCLVDEQHQEDLFQVACDLATTEHGRREVRHGMLTALQLRSDFWDFLYRRAVRLEQVA